MIRSHIAAIRSMPRRSQLSMVGVLLIALTAAGLLYRTEANAAQVSHETQRIAATGQGLNTYTDSIAQLGTTNRVASEILSSLSEVNANLSGIKGTTWSIASKATSINRSTASIDSSTASINSSEHSIDRYVSAINSAVANLNQSLAGINQNASQILAASLGIERGVALISSNLETARAITNEILGEATNINRRVDFTKHEAACVDNGLNGGQQC